MDANGAELPVAVEELSQRIDRLDKIAADERAEEERQERLSLWVPSGPTLPSCSRIPSNTTIPSCSTRVRKPRGNYNTMKVEGVSIGSSRYHLTNHAAAYVANLALEDKFKQLGLTWNKERDAIDPAKVLRGRIAFGKERIKARLDSMQQMKALYFDERKDETVISVEVETSVEAKGKKGAKDTLTTTIKNRTGKREHCPVLMWDTNKDRRDAYVRTIVVEVGDAPTLAIKLYYVLEERDSVLTVRILGSDSCPKNTGHLGGIGAELEKLLQRELQRILCLKHTVEVHWHWLFKFLDGDTHSADSFKGPIGKELSGDEFWTQDIVNFKTVKGGEVPQLTADELRLVSNDVKNLYRYYRLVTLGSDVLRPKTDANPIGGDVNLRFANPGPLHNARWITLASWVLRYYVSQRKPSKALQKLVKYIVRVYVPNWFLIIKKQSLAEGPLILARIVANLQELAEEGFFATSNEYVHPKDARKKEKRIVSELDLMKNCVNDNAYFAHPENVLLSMVVDLDHPEYRQLARKTILAVREANKGRRGLRHFKPPEVDWEKVKAYPDFIPEFVGIDWERVKGDPDFLPNFEDISRLTEPPVTKDWTVEDLDAIVDDPTKFDLRHVPCHTTPVQRQVAWGPKFPKAMLSAKETRTSLTAGSSRRWQMPRKDISLCLHSTLRKTTSHTSSLSSRGCVPSSSL